MFFQVDESNVKDNGGSGNIINESGLFPITIERLEFSKKGNNQLDCLDIYYILENGGSGYLFGIWLKKKDGTDNEIGTSLLNNLLYLLGIKALKEPTKEKVTLKDGSTKDVLTFKEVKGKKVYVQIQEEFSKYNGQLRQNLSIRGFFKYDNKASPGELIANNEELYGSRFAFLENKGFSPKLREGVSQLEVSQWKKAQENKNNTIKEDDAVLDEKDSTIPF